jgi:4'-phosphopantetheinyl transferase EntD
VTRARAFAEVEIGSIADPSFLSDIERGYLAKFGARRIEEFVAGRLAARRAIEALVGVAPTVIAREPDGAPRIEGIPPGVRLAISITHGKRLAIALAALGSQAVGVDLTDGTDAPRIRRVARRAFPRDAERALALADDRSAIRAWAIKEAVAKTLRMGLLEQSGFERIEVVAIDVPEVRVDGVAPQLTIEIDARRDGAVRASALLTGTLLG